jgi:hypothetical protein
MVGDCLYNGNCWRDAMACPECGEGTLCRVCHAHDENRCGCSVCPPCPNCKQSGERKTRVLVIDDSPRMAGIAALAMMALGGMAMLPPMRTVRVKEATPLPPNDAERMARAEAKRARRRERNLRRTETTDGH